MTTMAMGNRISKAVLLVLLGVILAASSHSTVEARVSSNNQSLHRQQRVRGLRREIGMRLEGQVEKIDEMKGEQKTGRIKPKLPEVFRPISEKFNKVGVKIDVAKAKVNAEPKLPEPQQALDIKVNKQSGANLKIGNPRVGVGVGGMSSLLKGNDRIKIGKKTLKEEARTGLEHFQEVEVEVYRREVPSFSLQFIVDPSSSTNNPGLADYNELTDVSEEYLDSFFRSVFEDVQVRHDGTALFLMVDEDDPFTVDYRVTLEFIIPGEVPTINFLIDNLQLGLERETSKASFISDLSSMSETNPFSKTTDFNVISRPSVSAAEMDRTGGKPQVGGTERLGKNNVLISLLAGTGLVVLVGVGLMWRKKKFNRGAVSDSNQTFSLFDKTNKKGTSTAGSKTSGLYGADEETMNYLNSIRKRYRDGGSAKSSPSASNGNNIAAVDHDDDDDSMCDTVGSGSDHEKNGSGEVEDALRSIY